MFALQFKVGNDWHWKTGFNSEKAADNFRLNHTSAYIWYVLQFANGRWNKLS